MSPTWALHCQRSAACSPAHTGRGSSADLEGTARTGLVFPQETSLRDGSFCAVHRSRVLNHHSSTAHSLWSKTETAAITPPGALSGEEAATAFVHSVYEAADRVWQQVSSESEHTLAMRGKVHSQGPAAALVWFAPACALRHLPPAQQRPSLSHVQGWKTEIDRINNKSYSLFFFFQIRKYISHRIFLIYMQVLFDFIFYQYLTALRHEA